MVALEKGEEELYGVMVCVFHDAWRYDVIMVEKRGRIALKCGAIMLEVGGGWRYTEVWNNWCNYFNCWN